MKPKKYINFKPEIAANYCTEWETDKYILIRDIGPHDVYKTVTNAAEWVVKNIVKRLGNRKLYYIDSNERTDQLLIHDGKFAGFATGGPDDGR
ncbi:MAG: hypothetical protein GY815_07280 [Gammaproteobacteria bacterium]|nr:hypothetical protein [Gammaproteobacteria bacterium]